jgi:hypothetical protein
MLRRNNRFVCGWQNLPANCQAQDNSKYRFTLLKAISPVMRQLRRIKASLAEWLTLDGRYKVAAVPANDR